MKNTKTIDYKLVKMSDYSDQIKELMTTMIGEKGYKLIHWNSVYHVQMNTIYHFFLFEKEI